MKQRVFDYSGERLVVHYDLARCIHAGECVRGLPKVFAPRRKPWVEPDQASADEVVEVVARCPTGALSCSANEASIPQPESVPTARIDLVESGPLYLKGHIQLVDGDSGDVLLSDTRLALCRCGESKNKPLCDGRHADAEFADPGTWNGDSAEADSEGSGQEELAVTPVYDGPLIVRGDFEIHDAEGAVCFRGEKAALCRCGASERKPLCDGSHKKVEFRSQTGS